jgi:predicted adenylyl cyclase CyaB
MAKNIEIKARIQDKNDCIAIAERLSGAEAEIIKQEDTFFNCDKGRIKLRVFSKEKGLLIFYNRPDITGPKISEYHTTFTNEPDRLLCVLEKSYGSCGKVCKTRMLFHIGRTRVHIDLVDSLGDFMEFEVVLKEHENIIDGETKAKELMALFNISEADLISGAYVDMM